MRTDHLIKRTGTIALTFALLCSPVTVPALARHRTSHHSGSDTHADSGGHHTRHHSRHHGKQKQSKTAGKTRYAYPMDMFMMEAPAEDLTLLPADEALRIRYAFQSGTASNFSPQFLIRAGAVNYYALHGGIFPRREPVKYIIMHSTETGVPQDARHVVNSWSSGGRRHPGAQFIVDRDGTIYETVDPKYATVHVNIFKTRPGINNDNSVGIEMVHSGSQTYTAEQKASVVRLVTYLQDHFHVLDENIITHRYAQQGDHTDPVAFDWDGFLASKDIFHNKALAMVHESPADQAASTEAAVSLDTDSPLASVYLEMHTSLAKANSDKQHMSSAQELQRDLQSAQTAVTTQSFASTPAPDATVVVGQPSISAPATMINGLPLHGEIEVAPASAIMGGAR